MQSLQVPRADLMTLWIVLVVMWLGIRRGLLLAASTVFTFVLSIASVAMSGTWAAFTFSYWQSTAIRTDLLAILLPVTVMAVLRLHSGPARWLVRVNLVVHVASLTFVMVVSGSRLGAALIPLVLIMCTAVLVQQRRPLAAAASVLAAGAGLLGLYVTQDCSQVIKYGITRSPLFGAASRLEKAPARVCGRWRRA